MVIEKENFVEPDFEIRDTIEDCGKKYVETVRGKIQTKEQSKDILREHDIEMVTIHGKNILKECKKFTTTNGKNKGAKRVNNISGTERKTNVSIEPDNFVVPDFRIKDTIKECGRKRNRDLSEEDDNYKTPERELKETKLVLLQCQQKLENQTKLIEFWKDKYYNLRNSEAFPLSEMTGKRIVNIYEKLFSEKGK